MATNDDRFTADNQGDPTLSRQIIRYNSDYSERSRIQVTVTNPDTNRVLTVNHNYFRNLFPWGASALGMKSQESGGDMI